MTWDWEPSVLMGCAVLTAVYFAIARPRRFGQTFYFLAGVALLLLALVSPIDTLADSYLFSAHVVQHFLLALVIPPLWLLGAPRSLTERALSRPPIARIEHALSRVAWPVGVGTMLVWYIPALFNAALANEALHIFQHLSFLITGTIFWWPILAPLEARRLSPLPAIVYLFSACIACSLLGAVLTFTPPGWYPTYLNPVDRLGWGIDPRSDQQLGGMLMWVPGCLVYLAAILACVARWYAEPESA